jgi:hypothetical protein
MNESPFRFVVIDDPVQAMDPNRIDGLARALELIAKSRQVVVFTHDERLPQAVRRLQIGATVIQVQRRINSVVELQVIDEPVKRYLDDALALALTNELPDSAKTRAIPLYLRLAVEAASHEVVWRRRLRKGVSHDEIQQALADKRTRQVVALALFDDESRAGEVMPKLNDWGRQLADVYRQINEGVHGEPVGGFGELINATRSLVQRIRDQS